MLKVEPERRITVDGALKHPWITQRGSDPADSCSSLTDAIGSLDFRRRRVTQERTLLAEAPDLASQTTTKSQSQTSPQRGRKPAGTLDPSTKAFVHVGGKGGDEALYDESYYKVPSGGEDDSD